MDALGKIDLLPDATGDRQCKTVDLPPNRPLTVKQLYPFTGADATKPDWKMVKQFLLREGYIGKEAAVKVTKQCIDILKKEPNLLYIEEPIVIVGDLHGQYYDLCHMLDKAGTPSDINYLFLGDYVDRGIYGVEIMLLLMCIKINYPKNIILLRGNHESRNMTENFTFREEAI